MWKIWKIKFRADVCTSTSLSEPSKTGQNGGFKIRQNATGQVDHIGGSRVKRSLERKWKHRISFPTRATAQQNSEFFANKFKSPTPNTDAKKTQLSTWKTFQVSKKTWRKYWVAPTVVRHVFQLRKLWRRCRPGLSRPSRPCDANGQRHVLYCLVISSYHM